MIKLPWPWIMKLKTIWKIASNAQFVLDQEKLVAALKQNWVLEEENKRLVEQLQIKATIKFDGEFLWLNDEKICLNCHDASECSNRKIVRLLRSDCDESESYNCPHCKTPFYSVAAKKRSRDRRRASSY